MEATKRNGINNNLWITFVTHVTIKAHLQNTQTCAWKVNSLLWWFLGSYTENHLGVPWQSSGQDLAWGPIRSLVGEQRPCMPLGVAKFKNKQKKHNKLARILCFCRYEWMCVKWKLRCLKVCLMTFMPPDNRMQTMPTRVEDLPPVFLCPLSAGIWVSALP